MRIINNGLSPVKVWDEKVDIEPEAINQAINLSMLPFIYKWVALMPDAHYGIGSTVGSVIATDKAIIPAAVGVDIGCGMHAVRTGLEASDIPDNLRDIRRKIEQDIPVGFNKYNDKNIPEALPDYFYLMTEYEIISTKYPKIITKDHPIYQLGTLGGGNHFIEICVDQFNDVWIMLHSGSRGIGNRIGNYFIEQAKKDMEKYFINLPDKDLAYLPEGSENFNSYMECVNWAQEYAVVNRKVMMKRIINALEKFTKPFIVPHLPDLMAINCHHNYVQKENHYDKNIFITRKGAISARKGQLGIIPGSMGIKSYIVEGLGNEESFQSCSHGAGRAMSRAQARKIFTINDLEYATEGVECRKDKDVIDEIPMAYKDIVDVMESQKDLVKPLYTLEPILCVKG